jgi:hypothetical protein
MMLKKEAEASDGILVGIISLMGALVARGQLKFSSIPIQHYGPHLSMGPWYMVVHPHNKC